MAVVGDGAGVVPRIRLLLEGGVVLFVDDDQSEVVDGREDRGASADDDASLPGSDPLPLVTSLRLGER